MTFNFWKNKKENIYDIQKYWDDLNRQQLKERYDYREGAFDWDLQMKLREYGAKQICSQEYKHWRETGIAFSFPEYEHALPNKTFAMDLRRVGQQWFHRGYVGDMSVGPFISFGIECSDEKMHKSNFGTNQCRATDVTERNVFELMWEIKHQERFDPTVDKKHFRAYGAVKLQTGAPIAQRSFEDSKLNLVNLDKPLKSSMNVRIHFLSVDDILNIQQKQEFQRKFDIVYIAHNYFPLLKKEFNEVLNDQALMLLETKKYSVMKQGEINESIQTMKNFCKQLELAPTTSSSLNFIASILKYKKTQ